MNNEELKELAAVLNGIADGKKWQFEDVSGNWRPAECDSNPLNVLKKRLKIRLTQWVIPNPPIGYEWHRPEYISETDWVNGLRPLLYGEPYLAGDEYCIGNGLWGLEKYTGSNCPGVSDLPKRTRRPLPPPKPQLREVELCADDVKAGDEFLVGSYRHTWLSIKDGYVTYGSGGIYSFEEMMRYGHKIRSIGENEWRKCSRMEEVPA